MIKAIILLSLLINVSSFLSFSPIFARGHKYFDLYRYSENEYYVKYAKCAKMCKMCKNVQKCAKKHIFSKEHFL